MTPDSDKSHTYDLRINSQDQNYHVRACLESGDIYPAEMSEHVFSEFCAQAGINFAELNGAFDSSFHGPVVVEDVRLSREQLQRYGFVRTQ